MALLWTSRPRFEKQRLSDALIQQWKMCLCGVYRDQVCKDQLVLDCGGEAWVQECEFYSVTQYVDVNDHWAVVQPMVYKVLRLAQSTLDRLMERFYTLREFYSPWKGMYPTSQIIELVNATELELGVDTPATMKSKLVFQSSVLEWMYAMEQ